MNIDGVIERIDKADSECCGMLHDGVLVHDYVLAFPRAKIREHEPHEPTKPQCPRPALVDEAKRPFQPTQITYA